MSDFEARARLTSILSVLEREAQGFELLEDPRLDKLMKSISFLRAEIIATLGELHERSEPNGDTAA